MSNEIQFPVKITEDDWDLLLMMMGYAMGAALKQNDRGMARRFLELINRVNEHNPQFTPYEIPAEEG